MSRPAVARIRLNALRHNYLLARRLHGHRALAVVKANAYGHGAVRCAEALSDCADGFAVASIEEAVILRGAGIKAPILLLEGFFETSELPVIERERLWTVVHNEWQVEALALAQLDSQVVVWLKMDSGMRRVGLTPAAFRRAHDRLEQSGRVSEIVLMTHFASADEPTSQQTDSQIALFWRTIEGMERQVSLCNSAGILGWPRAHGDWARPGIMLYGIDPCAGATLATPGIKPVMQLESKIIAVRDLDAGETLGYGAAFVAPTATRVGVVACGYADGYPRAAPTGTPVCVDGIRTRLIGRVSMDMLNVDLTDIPRAGLGSTVELWGDSVSATEVAANARTIPYELFCNVKRVRFEYARA